VLEIRRGPDFGPLLRVALPLAATADWEFALGRRDGDSIPDIFALDPARPARLFVATGADGFTGEPEVVTTAVGDHDGPLQTGDLDGDGRDDLLFFDADGTVTAYLGGDRAGSADTELLSWVLEGDDQPWEYRAGCPFDPFDPRAPLQKVPH
jgi:hypothetical protein